MNAADFPKHVLVKLLELDGSVQQLVNRAVDLDGGIQNARRILSGNVQLDENMTTDKMSEARAKLTEMVAEQAKVASRLKIARATSENWAPTCWPCCAL
jgi:hypothetical protein